MYLLAFYLFLGAIFHCIVEWEWNPKNPKDEWLRPIAVIVLTICWPVLFFGKSNN